MKVVVCGEWDTCQASVMSKLLHLQRGLHGETLGFAHLALLSKRVNVKWCESCKLPPNNFISEMS